MKRGFLKNLRCVFCFCDNLALTVEDENENEVRAGHMTCAGCGHVFGVRNGIPELFPALDPSISAEIKSLEGTSALIRLKQPEIFNERWLIDSPYVQTDRRVPSSKSYHDGGNIITFEQLLGYFPAGEGRTVLDVGANTCWATRYLTRRGFRCTAMDVVRGMYCGLESGDVYMKHDGIYFERILGVMERMPFAANRFDYIFSLSTVHHSSDLQATFREFHRVLKDNGTAIWADATAGLFTLARAKRGARKSNEEDHLNDHVFTYCDYLRNIRKAGFKCRLLFPENTLRKHVSLRMALYHLPPRIGEALLVLLHLLRGLGFVVIMQKP